MRNPYLHLVKTAWVYAGNRRTMMLLTYLMFFVVNLISMTEPLIVAKIFNLIQTGGVDLFTRVLPWILLLLGIDIAFWILHGPARVIERKTAFVVSKNYIQEMFQKVTDLPLKWHRDHHTGETYDKVDKARKALYEFTDGSWQYLETIVRMAFAFVAIISFLPLYGSLVFVVGFLVVLTMRIFDKVLVRNQSIMNDQENQVSSALFDYISNITTVITLRLQKLAKTEVGSRVNRILDRFYHNAKLNEWKWFSTNMIVRTGMVMLLLIYISQQIQLGEAILVGSIVALYQYLERLNNAFFSVAWQWEGLIFRSTHVRSAETIVKAHQQYFRKHKRLSLPRKWKSIQITELNFRYEDDRNHVHHLKNIDLTLERGKRIALVGSSGSGKTTLMKLLRELDTPDSARVLIDGKSFPDLTVLNQTTTLFPQDPEIFENSIEYNITAGISHRTEEVINAVRLAKFDAVVERLPQGLDSHIQEKGVNLSGGEKQRLSLARGIFAARDSSIILLDEPTSSVDTINEREIYENLFQHFKSQCIVSSIHRLHLLPLFDMIYVLQRGEVVEKGTFDQLRNNPGGVLNKMWEQYRVSAKG